MRRITKTAGFVTAGLTICLVLTQANADSSSNDRNQLAELGRALFFDTNLSANRNQSCASCHNPAVAFTDSRDNGVLGAFSLGDDGVSLGTRNAPTISYASLIPEFGKGQDDEYIGGQFYDGRAKNLHDQAAEPFTNPIEMAMPDSAAVVERVLENSSYVQVFKKHYGDDVFERTEGAFNAITESIAAFEQTEQFSPFDSKYDRYLRGEYQLTHTEEVGRVLFYSQLFNCHTCHLVDTREFQHAEPFTTYRYHNIGVPINDIARDVTRQTDFGLLQNPRVDDAAQAGKLRVPTLRNVAVTGPYMHNGVFQELDTVILFYNKFTLSNPESQMNPETGEPWGDAEVPETVDLDLLQQGMPISDMHVEALVAFLRTLTDRQYESLLD